MSRMRFRWIRCMNPFNLLKVGPRTGVLKTANRITLTHLDGLYRFNLTLSRLQTNKVAACG